jgi:hypothetical protein
MSRFSLLQNRWLPEKELTLVSRLSCAVQLGGTHLLTGICQIHMPKLQEAAIRIKKFDLKRCNPGGNVV